MTVAEKSGPPPIEVRGLRKLFWQATTGQAVVAIDRLDLTIAPKEVVAIVGQTGCGKSTFFDMMIGLEPPTEGTLRIGDKSPHGDFDYFRGKIATVFQQDRLLPWRSAIDNAKLPLELIGLPEDEQRERAMTWLKRLGLGNFIKEAHDPVFWRVVQNTFIYTGVATVLKMIGGLGLALAMNQQFRFKNLVRALLLLPFIVPTVLSTVAFMWMLDPAFSVVNRLLISFGVPKPGPSWLGNPILAMISIIAINTWRGLPFYGITLLAGLQTVPTELYEAATIDGAGGWQRFRYVTLPILQPIILIVTLFSVIFTFADFQLVYVLTHGGPQNATALFATYAFDIGMGGGQLGLGAAVALAMLPALALLIIAITLYLRKKDA